MPDMFAITQRAQEIVAERFARWYSDLQQSGQDAGVAGAPQRAVRAAFEQVQQADAASFPAARAAFEQRFGPDAWARQMQLQLRRRQPGQGQA